MRRLGRPFDPAAPLALDTDLEREYGPPRPAKLWTVCGEVNRCEDRWVLGDPPESWRVRGELVANAQGCLTVGAFVVARIHAEARTLDPGYPDATQRLVQLTVGERIYSDTLVGWHPIETRALPLMIPPAQTVTARLSGGSPDVQALVMLEGTYFGPRPPAASGEGRA